MTDFEEGYNAYFNIHSFDKTKSEEWQDGWCAACADDYARISGLMTKEFEND